MRQRVWIVMALTFAVLAAAGVATADEGTMEPALSPLSVEEGCQGEAGEGLVEEAMDAILAPEGQSRAFVCGSCSTAICQGQNLNSYCGFSGGQFKYCKSLLFNQCPGTSDFYCQCTSSNPP